MDVVDLPAPTPAPTEDDANQLRLLSIFH